MQAACECKHAAAVLLTSQPAESLAQRPGRLDMLPQPSFPCTALEARHAANLRRQGAGQVVVLHLANEARKQILNKRIRAQGGGRELDILADADWPCIACMHKTRPTFLLTTPMQPTAHLELFQFGEGAQERGDGAVDLQNERASHSAWATSSVRNTGRS